jgi:5'-nucleotidase
VTNDDGVHAPGIDVLVQALRKEPGLIVKVVAPATNQSGVGGKMTAGTVKYSNTTTLSGYPAVAVAGTPSDAVNVAITQLKLNPGLVMSGINAGQNLGPAVNLSGTVGAAREAARHGVPAIAVSSGFAPKYDFATAAKYALDWLDGKRHDLPRPASNAEGTVESLNVPTCPTGSVRGELRLMPQSTLEPGQEILGKSDCTSTAKPTTEVAAFTDGFATLVPLPVAPSP